MHYNRGSQVMNICVWPAVKISLITPRLESKAAYLAGQQAAGLRIQPPGDDAQPCCVMLQQGLFVLFVSLLSLCPSNTVSLQRTNSLKRAKRKVFTVQKQKITICQQMLVMAVDQYQLSYWARCWDFWPSKLYIYNWGETARQISATETHSAKYYMAVLLRFWVLPLFRQVI